MVHSRVHWNDRKILQHQARQNTARCINLQQVSRLFCVSVKVPLLAGQGQPFHPEEKMKNYIKKFEENWWEGDTRDQMRCVLTRILLALTVHRSLEVQCQWKEWVGWTHDDPPPTHSKNKQRIQQGRGVHIIFLPTHFPLKCVGHRLIIWGGVGITYMYLNFIFFLFRLGFFFLAFFFLVLYFFLL